MNKGSLRKRLLSLALAAVMMLGMVPSSAMTVFAAGEADNDPSKNAQVGVGDVISAAGVNGVDFKLQLQPMDVEGKIYSAKTLPKSMGGSHNRGLATNLAWMHPTAENQYAGGYAYCYDHTLDAGANMSVHVDETARETDPLSVLIYYNGYTSSGKGVNQAQFIYNQLKIIKEKKLAEGDGTWWNVDPIDFIDENWSQTISVGAWERATQLAIWMSQKTSDGTRMLYIQNQQEVDADGHLIGSWRDGVNYFDTIAFFGDDPSAQLNGGNTSAIYSGLAAKAIYLYATYLLSEGLDYTNRQPGYTFKLFEESEFTKKGLYKESEKTLDFSTLKADGSGTIVDAFQDMNSGGSGGQTLGIRDDGQGNYVIYMMFATHTQTEHPSDIMVDKENSKNLPDAGVYIAPISAEDYQLFPELQSVLDYCTQQDKAFGNDGQQGIPDGKGFITGSTSTYTTPDQSQVLGMKFPYYRKLVINKDWAQKCADEGTPVEIVLKAYYNRMYTYDMFIANNSVDTYQPFVIGGNWVNREDTVTVKWGGQQTDTLASFSIHKVRTVNGTTSNFPGVTFTATCDAYPVNQYPAASISATTDTNGIATFIIPGQFVKDSNGNYTTWKITETVPSGYNAAEKNFNVTLTKDGDNGLVKQNIVNTKKITEQTGDGHIFKVDLDGNPIGPATFKFWGQTAGNNSSPDPENPGEPVGQPYTGTFTTDSKGVLKLDWGEGNGGKYIPPGTYNVQEITPPAGCQKTDEIQQIHLWLDYEFEPIKDADGNITGYNTITHYYSSGPLTFKNGPLHTVTIKKVDARNNPLSGAQFDIYFNGAKVSSATTGSDGSFTYTGRNGEGLVTGLYKFVETKAPDGYSIPVGKESQEVYIDTSNLGTDTSHTLTFINYERGDIVIYKEDADSGKKLEGAVMEIKIDGKSLGRRTTGKGGAITLTYDDYKGFLNEDTDSWTVMVREIQAPSGYFIDDPHWQMQEMRKDQEGLVFTFTDTKYPEILIEKRDSETNKLLPGARFQVLIDGVALGVFETNADGRIEITYDNMRHFLRENAIDAYKWTQTPHTVTVIEIDPPGGYNLDKQNESGYTQTQQLIIGQELSPFVFEDTRYRSLKVVKKDGKTAWPLAGATFELKSIRLDNGGSYQQSLTTDETGSVLFEDIPNGTYELRETKAPLGYEKGDWVETIVVTSKSDIVMYREYTNEPMSGIVIKKIDAITGKAVPGVKFVITPMLPLTGPALERTTDEYGLIELEGLAMGTYEIKEISAPDPYIVDSNVRNVQLTNQHQSVTVEWPNYKRDTLYIQKTDIMDDTPLPGAYFDVWNAERTWVKHLGPTESNGYVMLENVAEGRYIVQEKTAPTGYVLDESEYDIEVISGKENVLVVGDNAYATLLARKIDSRTGKPIAGAVFKLETADHSLIGTLETDANGECLFTNLLAGHYIITETQAPPGYELSNPSSQTITIKYGVNNYVDFVDAEKGSLVIILQDKHTGEYLPGGQFIVTREDDQIMVYDGPTDITGTIVVGDLLPGWYTVEQYFAPDGYTIVDKQKKAEILVGEQTTVYFLDETASIVIEKYDSTNNKLMLEGARFQLTRDEDNVVIGEYVTDKDGMVMASGLVPGLYHVTELVAPEGYAIDEGPKLVHVKGGTAAHVAFSDTPLAGITVNVVDKNTRTPLTGCIVEVWRQNGEMVDSLTTDVTGTVQTNKLAAGHYVIKLVHVIDGYTATESEVTVEIKEGIPVTHVFECISNGILRVQSTTVDGKSVSGFKFLVTTIDGSKVGEYTTAANGVYTLPSLNPGWYRIIPVSAPNGYTLHDTAEKVMEIKAGNLMVAEFILQQNSSIRVKILDGETQKGIYGVRLLVKDSTKVIHEYTTDQSGDIYLEGEVLKGNYALEMISVPDGYHVDTVIKSIRTLTGETTDINWAIYKDAGQIQVVVTGSDYNATLDKAAGAVLQGAVFEITNADTYQVVGTMISDVNGIAASSGLPVGRYMVRMVTAPSFYALSTQQTEVRIKVNNDVVRIYDQVPSVNLKTEVAQKTNNTVRAGSNMRVDILQANNASDVRLDNFNLHMKLPTDCARVNTLAIGTWNYAVWYKVSYKTNMQEYKTLAANLSSMNKYQYDLSAVSLGLQAGEYVTDLRFEFGTVPAGFAMTSKSAMSLYVLSTVYNGHKMISNMEASGQYNTTSMSTTNIDNNFPYSNNGVYVAADGNSYGGSGAASMNGNSGQWSTATSSWTTTIKSEVKLPNTLPKTGY